MSILLYCCNQLVECISRSLFFHFSLRLVLFAYYNDFPARSGIILTRDNLIRRGCHYRSAKLEQNEASEDRALLPALASSRAYKDFKLEDVSELPTHGGPDDSGGYHAHMAVLVKPNRRFGKAYMAAIKPFRYAFVYLSLQGRSGAIGASRAASRLRDHSAGGESSIAAISQTR
jgi:hypothetical protein